MPTTQETLRVSRDEFEGLRVLQVRRRREWSACFSVNIHGEIWPFVTFGYTHPDRREELRGQLPLLDELANRFLLLRAGGGRMFLSEEGLFYWAGDDTKELLLAFRIVDGPVTRPRVSRPTSFETEAQKEKRLHEEGRCSADECPLCGEERAEVQRVRQSRDLERKADVLLGATGRKKRWER